MTTFRISAVSLLVVSCAIASSAAAQDERRMNDVGLRRAESTRVGDYCGLAEEIVAAPSVMQRLSDPVAARAHVATICNPEFEELSLLQLTAGAPASFGEVARLGTRDFAEGARRITLAMSSFNAMVAQPNVMEALNAALSAPRKAAWVSTAEVWEWTADATSSDGALGRLSKYERKFGPTAPRLNGIEVVVNFLAQAALPGFRATPFGGPGHWELVASYAPAYETRINERYTPVAAAEFGLRHYMFGDSFGRSGIAGIFWPSYWGVGAITASNRNGALIWPWRAQERTGGYLAWGSIKVAYIKRGEGEWLVSKQFQAIPFVF